MGRKIIIMFYCLFGRVFVIVFFLNVGWKVRWLKFSSLKFSLKGISMVFILLRVLNWGGDIFGVCLGEGYDF